MRGHQALCWLFYFPHPQAGWLTTRTGGRHHGGGGILPSLGLLGIKEQVPPPQLRRNQLGDMLSSNHYSKWTSIWPGPDHDEGEMGMAREGQDWDTTGSACRGGAMAGLLLGCPSRCWLGSAGKG